MLLDIRNLTIEIPSSKGNIKIIDGFSLTLREGEIYGLVGESGSGKSLIARTILGLTKQSWIITADKFRFNQIELLKLSPKKRRKLVGSTIAMIFQDAKSSLDPSIKIGKQLKQNINRNILQGYPLFYPKERKLRAIEMLHRVGIKNHQEIMCCYPHQLTEGICQKIVIAMALINKPKLLIADELTNTLASAAQSQILRLLASMTQNSNTTILMISHDLRMLSYWADKINVMYCGQLVEVGKTKELLSYPQHPYTQSLVRSLTIPTKHQAQLYTLQGASPPIEALPIGCRFGPRCAYAQRKCIKAPPLDNNQSHRVACYFPLLIREE